MNTRTRSDSTKGKAQGDTFVEKKRKKTLPLHFIASREYTAPQGYLQTQDSYTLLLISTGVETRQVHHITTGEHQIKPTKE
jgi:hypothetical protein